MRPYLIVRSGILSCNPFVHSDPVFVDRSSLCSELSFPFKIDNMMEHQSLLWAVGIFVVLHIIGKVGIKRAHEHLITRKLISNNLNNDRIATMLYNSNYALTALICYILGYT